MIYSCHQNVQYSDIGAGCYSDIVSEIFDLGKRMQRFYHIRYIHLLYLVHPFLPRKYMMNIGLSFFSKVVDFTIWQWPFLLY